MVGTNVRAEVFHIGSPSDQTGSDFQSVRSRSTHSLNHIRLLHQFLLGLLGHLLFQGMLFLREL